ncbi:cellulose binding domain-containing protein [Actinoplanes bogorensis]|uniref:Cellulose binding domain-containing protein n=1 Tax=Paractinoplanes bogorensis TaxID=1610840 RepID=A0ABS5Z0T8_9ACTN|nr:cellulose binding domain-containing protein [Actinoplanes bogorensis]MBU2669121.1 cellulose binding domain-containing protein [Actinoplanes bogorensis]
MGTRIRTLLASFVALAALTGAAPPPSTPAPPIPSPTGQPPSAPADFRATAVTPTSVTLSWTASVPGSAPLAEYAVNYTQAFNDIYWSQPVGNVTTVTITGNIRAGQQYRFSVLARGTDGLVATSPEGVTVVTPVATTGDTTPPSTPTGLRATDVTATDVALSWTAATDNVGVAGYNVYFFDGWYTSTLVATATGTSVVAPLRNAALGRYYYVRAKDAAGNVSIASNLVNVAAPPPRTCKVTYRSTSEWKGGFVADVTVTNTGTTAVDGWTLTLAMGGDQRVSSAWNASFTQDAATVTLTAARWNTKIPAGGSVTAGILGRWTTSNAAPTSFALNGSPCA